MPWNFNNSGRIQVVLQVVCWAEASQTPLAPVTLHHLHKAGREQDLIRSAADTELALQKHSAPRLPSITFSPLQI